MATGTDAATVAVSSDLDNISSLDGQQTTGTKGFLFTPDGLWQEFR